jgi:hypothetical protein
MSKSVFVASSPQDIKVFNYHSPYEIADKAALLLCKNPLLLASQAYKDATLMLTGVSPAEYKTKIDELFLTKESIYKEPNSIWENFNFPALELDFSQLQNHKNRDDFQPKKMFERGLAYMRRASLFQRRNRENAEEFLPAFKLRETSNISSTFFDPRQIVFEDEKDKKDFSQKMLHTFWNFQKRSSAYEMLQKNASALYYAKYSKDFINLHENNFFDHSTKTPDDLKFGVSVWAELRCATPMESLNAGITEGVLYVTYAKSYLNGETQALATLRFEYTSCFYKDHATNAIYPATNEAIQKALGKDVYRVLSQQFYPLYGINAMQGEGIAALSEHFTYDEGERGAVLNLKEINISQKYSDKIIPDLIRALYDLINFNSGSTFPLGACMVDGDVIVNEELFPLIKSPLFTVISAKYLTQRLKESKDSFEFFSQYKANAHHYYNSMSFDPLRPIYVY